MTQPAMRSADVRPATAMDSVNIVRLIKDGWKDTPAAQVSVFNEHNMLEYVTKTIGHSFSLVVDLHGRVLGSVALVPIRMPWSKDAVMAEAWFAVQRQQRDRGIPEALLDVCDGFLDKNDWPVLWGTNAIVPSDFNAILVKRGYETLRSSYLRMPNVEARVITESA